MFNCSNRETLFTTPLECLSQQDLEKAGGKAANLGELLRAGFTVPAGFAVTTTAYTQFVEHHSLREEIERRLRVQPGSGEAIRAAFEAAPIPEEIERDVLAAYRKLGEGPVAVRSSATAEDLPEAAFAGQQDTYLNITGKQELLEAVRRCWASLWTDRAIAYRDRQGVDQSTVRLAVVVQQMVEAEAAGVMFTASPVTGARRETVIDATPGLGEAVVSGLVTPDHYVLRKLRWGWKVVERRAGQREVVIRSRAGGGTEHFSGAAQGTASVLPARALQRLARAGSAIQQHFGRPQDIEWAWAGGKLYILQSRPITALPEPPPAANKLERLLAANFAEMLPVRPYPLDLDTWLPALGSAVEPIFELLGLDWNFRRMFVGEDSKDAVIAVRFSGKLPRPTWKTVLAPFKLAAMLLRHNPARWKSDTLLDTAKAQARQLGRVDLQAIPWGQLLGIFQEAKEIPHLAGVIRVRYFPGAACAAARLRILLKILGHPDKLGLFLASAGTATLEMNQALDRLADQVRSSPVLAATFASHTPQELETSLEQHPEGQAFLTGFESFLDSYGHRETVISTAREPAWKDAPEIALGVIKGFAAHPSRQQAGQPSWTAARDEILKHPLMRFAFPRRAFLEILEKASTLMQIREDTHFYATLTLPVFRRAVLESGRRLVEGGVLEAAEDVFHLTLSELAQLGDVPPEPGLASQLRAAVEQRREARRRLESIPLVDPRLFPRSQAEAGAVLSGMPGSPGSVEGPARIVHDISEFGRLTAGDVLVAPYTNPSWTPLFQRAAAVVVDSGSPASHAAIVAREYGIPAVMATLTGTQTLHDGEWVKVDGSLGAVYRLEQGPPDAEGDYAASDGAA